MGIWLDKELARRIESHIIEGNRDFADSWNKFGFVPHAELIEVGEGAVGLYAGSTCPMNSVVGLGMDGPVTEDQFVQVEEFYRERSGPANIRACSLAHASLFELLHKRGYLLKQIGYRWVLDITEWKSHLPRPDARVRLAGPHDEAAWVTTVDAGFADADESPPDETGHFSTAYFHMRGNLPVLAEEQGQAAAGGILAFSDSLASLFATSTRLSFRRRGLQTALLDWRLRYAQDKGAELATIETDPGSASQRNVERAGFRLAYMVLEMEKDTDRHLAD